MGDKVQGGLLKGKNGLIMGVANERSIAWGVAKQAYENGANLAFSYQGEILKKRVEPLAESLNCKNIFEADASSDESIDKLFENVLSAFNGKIDFVVHSIAFASKECLRGGYVDTTREDFAQAMDISCYSLVSVTRSASKFMKNNEANGGSKGSIVTMSYLGSERVIPNYNMMGVAKSALESSVRYLASDLGKFGIRVNSVSPGPIKTLAASGIGDFGSILDFQEKNSPLRRNVNSEDVGQTTAFLLSDMSSGITGENIYVDGGYNTIGIPVSLTEK